MNSEGKPSEVPPRAAKQAGEALELRERLKAERCVWTDRMLAALESGVKGGKWFSLHDKTGKVATLRAAWEQARSRGGKGGVDGQSLGHFERHLDVELAKLSGELADGSYRPKPVRRVWIPKPGSREKRPLGIPTVRDRVVQAALLATIGPIFEIGFEECSYGFRPGRGCRDALREVDAQLKAGACYVVDADLKGYFDAIDHDLLMGLLAERIADGNTLSLVRLLLKQGAMESHKGWKPTPKGTPQGAVISPLLSNVYLHGLDARMREQGYEMVRYADDFVILCPDRAQAEQALEATRSWSGKMKLTLHPEKTRIVHVDDKGGFEFLGYRFEKGRKFPRDKSLGKLKDAIRRHTKRCNGNSMESIVESINPTLRGWLGYFKHGHRATFPQLDSWIRMRLRSIYRKRAGKKGKGRGSDHVRYPNRHFAEMGLYSLVQAHREACQSR